MKFIFKSNTILAGIIFCLLFTLLGSIFQSQLLQWLNALNRKILFVFDTYYLVLGFFVVVLACVIYILPQSKQRLGDEAPEYSYFSWIALLYSTGMGSGLLLRAVQEPTYYVQHPPIQTAHPEILSLQYTFFHWGLTPWAFYSLFGLLVAYNLYIKKAPHFQAAVLPISTKNSLKEWTNIFISLITIVGIIASLGLGAGQFIGGINAYFGLNLGHFHILLSVGLIGIIATLSALTGIQKAIKFLADFDMIASILLMLFIAFFLDLPSFLSNTSAALGNYLVHFPMMSTATWRYQVDQAFIQDWTVFYWAFWLAWVPFTGIFIARISKGRTIRSFLLGTILVPTFATFLWFAVFGNKAFENIALSGSYTGKYDSVFTSLFYFLQELPFNQVSVLVTALLILVALINSVDSAIFVLGMFSDEGKSNPNYRHKIIWGGIIVLTSLSLILIGENDLLQAVSAVLIIMALPFSVLYMYLIFIFIKQFYFSDE